MGTTSVSAHYARRVEASTAEQAAVARVPRLGAGIADTLITHLSDKSTNPDRQDLAKETVRYIKAIREMSNQGRREVLGLLWGCRKGELTFGIESKRICSRTSTELAVQSAIGALRKIYTLRLSSEGPDKLLPFAARGEVNPFDQKFLSSAMLLSRAVAPLGINIVQPEWSDAGKTSISAQKTSALWLHSRGKIVTEAEAIVMKPSHDGQTLRVKLIPPGKTWSKVTEEALLHSGESLTIGRRLHLHTQSSMHEGSLFGLSIPDIIIDPQLKPSGDTNSHVAYSRAAIVLVRVGDDLYILDCGSRKGITSPLENGACITYNPHTVVDQSGRTMFGETRIDDVPKPLL